ncbi:HypC/HybG/HupF family hydrogenase formation chaperone [Streptomyces sp. NBC_01381]|uniref:HypC/HybG/HupF family hydrogenase formation chaperone n=1 Tax=Streptomyces sp. NBC_01381 TaxID=2903845 RepID=UPI00225A3824|nr:HypC/HybG/HupF family hydrogenase formation chaperone [Streptomyces sp. NBC_01381]MCX4673004.1 HypC/HybG/HupF family hydrogenase formation chaperone [Streptomyces sp. NBC_01381]
MRRRERDSRTRSAWASAASPVLEVHDNARLRMATVVFGGVRREGCLGCTSGTDMGSYVIVHVGFAITEVDEAETRRMLEVLRAMAGSVATELGDPLP